MTEHTQGTWRTKHNGKFLSTEWVADKDRPKHGTYCQVPIKCGKRTLALVVHEGMSNEHELDANAHLIAAAPDLYDALEKAVNDYGKQGGPRNVPSQPGAWLSMAREALAKARGE